MIMCNFLALFYLHSYIYDMEWLLQQYPEKYRHLPMLLVVQQTDELLQLLIAQRQVVVHNSLFSYFSTFTL